MTEKIRKILSLVLALMLATFVFASSFAETAEDPDDGEDLVSFEDDYNGYVAADVIKEHTPAMTSELIHADDSKYDQKAEDEQPAAAEPSADAVKEAETVESEPVTAADAELPEDAAEEETAENKVTASEADETEPDVMEEDPEVQEGAEPEESTEEESGSAEETDPDATDEDPEAQEGEEPEETEDESDGEEETEGEDEEEEDPDQIVVSVEIVMISENEMKLVATVKGGEEMEYLFQWQVSEDEGESFADIEDETRNELIVELTEENIDNLWRVRVEPV